MFTRLYLCLPHFTRARLHIITHVYSCLPMFTLVYLCLPLFTCVYLCLHLFTDVYRCLPLFTRVYLCSLMLSYDYSWLPVFPLFKGYVPCIFGVFCLLIQNDFMIIQIVYLLLLSKKNYSPRYEPPKLPFFCFMPCYFLSVGVAKRDVTRGRCTGKCIAV